MAIPSQSAFPIVLTLGKVLVDTRCRKCAYNLRGLLIDGRCPECATPVGVSVNGDLLRYSDPEYVQTLHRGVTVVLWGIIAIIVVQFSAGFIANVTGGGAAGAAAFSFLANVPSLIGAWLLTTPDPGGIGEDQYGTMRKVIRITLGIGLAREFITFAARTGHASPAVAQGFYALAILAGLTGAVGQFAQLYYLHKLALRIPDYELSARAHLLMWAIGVSDVLLIVLAFAGGFGCFAVIVLVAFLVFGVMYLFMLGRFSGRLREQAILASQVWAGATAGMASHHTD